MSVEWNISPTVNMEVNFILFWPLVSVRAKWECCIPIPGLWNCWRVWKQLLHSSAFRWRTWVWLQYRARPCDHARFSTSCLHQRARLLRPIGRKGRCWFLWLTFSLFLASHPLSPCTFTLKCPFTSPLPLVAKNLWLLGFDFNHCLLTSPLWHQSMFSCCRASFFIHLYTETAEERYELIYLPTCMCRSCREHCHSPTSPTSYREISSILAEISVNAAMVRFVLGYMAFSHHQIT